MSHQLSLELNTTQALPARADWFAVSMSDEVAQRLLLIAKAHPGEWLEFRDFYPLAVELNIRAHLGHALYQMAIAGRIEKREIYFGAKHPSEANYLGFTNEYRYVEVTQ